MLLGDVVHCPAELLSDDWEMIGDVDKQLAQRTREALARELEGSDIPAAATHFPGLKFGRLLTAEGRRQWTFGWNALVGAGVVPLSVGSGAPTLGTRRREVPDVVADGHVVRSRCLHAHRGVGRGRAGAHRHSSDDEGEGDQDEDDCSGEEEPKGSPHRVRDGERVRGDGHGASFRWLNPGRISHPGRPDARPGPTMRPNHLPAHRENS